VPDASVPTPATAPDAVPAGRALVASGWATDALFAATAIPGAFASSDALKGVAIAVSLLLFLAGVVTCLYAFGKGLARSAAGDNVAVSNLFFLQGSAPRPVRRRFLAIFLACLAVAVVTAAGLAGFSVLVPMLPVGLAGTWAARHGVFPPRPPSGPRRR
jgi:hypothetical protein